MDYSEILKDLREFVRERFPLTVSLPLTLILFAGPASLSSLNPPAWICGWVSTFLALLCLRIADDLTDIETDKITRPQRGLSSGRIMPGNLKVAVAAGLAVILLINLPTGSSLLVAVVMISYGLYFQVAKSHVPLLIRAPLSNGIFGLLPCYSGLLNHNLLGSQFLLGLFVWLAAVGHEWAHNVHRDEDSMPGLAGYSQAVGPRRSALVAGLLFALAALCAWLAWVQIGQPPLFGVLLLLTSIHLGVLSSKLVQNPCYLNAKPFYIFGFTFFLLPLAGLWADSLLGNIRVALAALAQ